MARWQTDFVISQLAAGSAGLSVEALVVSTVGDRRLDVSIAQLGGKGSFAKEVQAAVLCHDADLAVHSAKDLPAVTPPGLTIGAVLERHDPRDALIGARLVDLALGARLGTGSPRRRIQLAELRPDLDFVEVRGNVGTRLARLREGQADALVLAVAGLERLGLAGQIAEILDPAQMLPQVGQGVLAVECRADDSVAVAAMAAIDHAPTRLVFTAERAFLARLGGDCNLPAGAHCTLGVDGRLTIDALLGGPQRVVRLRLIGGDAEALGREAAERLLAEVS